MPQTQGCQNQPLTWQQGDVKRPQKVAKQEKDFKLDFDKYDIFGADADTNTDIRKLKKFRYPILADTQKLFTTIPQLKLLNICKKYVQWRQNIL